MPAHDESGKGDFVGETTECPLLAVVPGAEPWPLRLQQRNGIRLSRGEVLQFGQRLFAIVAFDGRNDGYLCWECGRDGKFDITTLVCIDREKAHRAPRDLKARREVPTLPPLDHTGRILGTGGPLSRQAGQTNSSGALVRRCGGAEVQEFLAGSAPSSRSNTPMRRSQQAGSVPGSGTCTPKMGGGPQGSTAGSLDVPPPRGVGWSSSGSAPGTLPRDHSDRFERPPARFSTGVVISGSELTLARLTPERVKPCVLCVVIRALSATVRWSLLQLRNAAIGMPVAEVPPSPDLLWGRMNSGGSPEEWRLTSDGKWVRVNRDEWEDDAESMSSRAQTSTAHTHRGNADKSDCGAIVPYSPSNNSVEGKSLQITIPIVKPPGWQEVLPLVHAMPVTFDEKGVKEAMTVKTSKWGTFVDRQRHQLEKEIKDLRHRIAASAAAKAVAKAMAARSGEEPEPEIGDSEEPMCEDDIAELEQVVERMADWKDLSRYSGKSISMASTCRGNEMKIHVMAFAERDDGTGVDFMRLAYKKSVEVRPNAGVNQGILHQLGQTLRAAAGFLAPSGDQSEDSSDKGRQQKWVELLQQPDVAKFAIALAFKDALEDDGIRLSFSEARFDHAR